MISFGSRSLDPAHLLQLPFHGALQHRAQILLHGQALEDRRLLGEIAQAHARARVHRLLGHVHAVDDDGAILGRHEARQAVEGRRLARAVGSEQPHDFAGVDAQGQSLDHHAFAVRLADVSRFEPHFDDLSYFFSSLN
jgi:hypothetical protein